MSKGFTLLELVIVIAMLALLSGIGARYVLEAAHKPGARADRVASQLATAQRDAIRQGRPVAVSCAELRGVSTGSDKPANAGIPQLRCRSAVGPTSATDRIVFYPDGSSSGATIEIGLEAERESLMVDWFSGAVKRGR